jgi:hypothetical protein
MLQQSLSTILLGVAATSGRLVYPKQRPAPGVVTNRNVTPRMFGTWYLSLLFTDGARRGTLKDGTLAIGEDNGRVMARVVLPGDGGMKNVLANQSGTSVTLTFDDTTLQGQYRGDDILTGNLTALDGSTGRWVASREIETITKIAGRFDFSATFGSQQVSGRLELNQRTNLRPGFWTVYPAITGQLATPGGIFVVNGIANGGEVFLLFTRGGDTWLAYDTNLADDKLGGTLYIKGGTGSWQATLLPDLPNIGRKWEFGAQGTDLQGVLSLQADGRGNLSGTLVAPDGKALGTALGTITSQGQFVFDLNGYRFEGQYEFALEQTVAGVYTELKSGKISEWRMSIPH